MTRLAMLVTTILVALLTAAVAGICVRVFVWTAGL